MQMSGCLPLMSFIALKYRMTWPGIGAAANRHHPVLDAPKKNCAEQVSEGGHRSLDDCYLALASMWSDAKLV